MSLAKTSAVALRVQTQLRRDHRSMAMVLLVPCMLLWILQITFANVPGIFDRIGPLLLGVFPFTLIFLVTSITMLRERNQGTLDRMLISPMSRFDIMVGYSVAFGALAIMQSLIAVIFAVTLLDMPVNGNIIEALMIVALVALYGIALGLTLSAFARSEFQAVQFMPLFLLPQIFLSGLLVPVQQLPTVLRWLAYVNPLKYVLALLTAVMTHGESMFALDQVRNLAVAICVPVAILLLGAATMKRQSED